MKYKVYGIMAASVFLGEYEAESPESAKDLADEDNEANWYPSLCYQCSQEVELEDIYETQVVKID